MYFEHKEVHIISIYNYYYTIRIYIFHIILALRRALPGTRAPVRPAGLTSPRIYNLC